MAEEIKNDKFEKMNYAAEIIRLRKQVFWLSKNMNDILGNNGADHAPIVKVRRGISDPDIENTKMISKKHDSDSCYDICAHFPKDKETFNKATELNPKLNATMAEYNFSTKSLRLNPGDTFVVPTNISLELPNNIECQCRPRSGLSADGKLVTLGTVDEGYRGEIGIILTNTTHHEININDGDRIAQLAFVRKTIVEVVDYTNTDDTSSETDRGTGGFGSTGV